MANAINEKQGETPYYPVLIIGAGASGIATGCQLKQKLGFDQFKIVDRQSGIGGTWWINRYPGVQCDVPTSLYSFSFAPNYTSKRLYPTGEEFREYLHDITARYQLAPHIQLNTDVKELRWIESDGQWEVTLQHLVPGVGDLSTRDREDKAAASGHDSVYLQEEVVRAKTVVSCVGILVEPNPWPTSIPGRDTFKGEVFHSARWRDDINLNGKDIIVLGTGCSAAQVVPSLLKEPYQVKSLTQIGRSAPWVMPRLSEPFGQETYAKYAPTIYKWLPFLGYVNRVLIYLLVEVIWSTVFQMKHKKWRAAIEKQQLEMMRSIVPEKYHNLMTPDYPYGCKRRVFDTEWLPSMHKPNYALTNRRILAVDGSELVLGPEVVPDGVDVKGASTEERVHADVIILANGFEATRWLHPLSVYGRDGVALQDVWKQRGGPAAYMGMAVDGFPNFFIAVGPNTANGHHSLILTTENTVSYILKMIKPIIRGQVDQVEVKKEAVTAWTEDVKQGLEKTVFVGCRSWYLDEEGYNSTMYPRSQTDFTLKCMFPKYADWNAFTSSGATVPLRGSGFATLGASVIAVAAAAWYAATKFM
ncbi:monooxygenase [Pyrenophora tritici-repentis]|nr:Flavin-binding monooxygenase [Pyrenophora tritici-repentis]KAF7448415.1 Flavin-binding monooxygenase [Pyrenophora tritici-repentis]KAG9384686.1 Flavin-binding monooxygenase [Pyrenophora tritici-repentis]KAI0579683.1 Flavin-binding monooxygenase [Pyrenophora tritici-repentis]KAI0588307.1 Flavin-binding monooxygenase [Pyrenophora tritici-repentis]